MTAEDSDLGLNLVFTNPASSSTTEVANSKKKRKNKYDRRRERGRQAKEAKKLEKTNNSVDSKTDGVGRSDGGKHQKSKSSMVVSTAKNASDVKKAVNVDDTDVTKKAEIGKKDDTSNNNASKVGGKEIDTSSEHSADKIDTAVDRIAVAAKPLTPQPVTTSKPISQGINNDNTAKSRRHRPETSLDEEERSKYLSEFHARPRDLDRNERASKNIKASVASDHIFGTSNEDSDGRDDAMTDDEGGSRNETKASDDRGVDTAPSCPFRKIGVHSNLVSTITSPDGNFRLKQPTIVQTRSIAALLPSSNNKSKKKKRGQNTLQKNLFIQSETGSGKTLAYLLPILQQLAVDAQTDRLKKVDRQLGGTRCIILCPTRELAHTNLYHVQ